jgi:signal transduction histidine kinase
MAKKHKRERFFVDASVQGLLLRRIVLHWVLFFFVACMSVIALQVMMDDPGRSINERLQTVMRDFSLTAVILLTLLPAFLLDTIRLSNRFVGPITRLRSGLREIGSGEKVRRITFRDNDLWKEAASEFNSVLDKVTEQQEEIERLKRLLDCDVKHAKLRRTEELEETRA